MTIEQLRRYAIERSLFSPTTLPRAIARLGFVQADPIRAPARAQDLTLRHRVTGYRAGELERRYARLALDESFFINYGFVPRDVHALMHPRSGRLPLTKRGRAVLDFVRERGTVHPRDVDAHFQHGRVKNWWGGQSSATTWLLEDLHYRGLLRVARREAGIRVYALANPGETAHTADERLDRLIDVVVAKYAPVPAVSLGMLVGRLRYAVPQLAGELRRAVKRARDRLAHDAGWYWPEGERVRGEARDEVRILGPFDPLVWDRRRFELFWSWAYRFEAYTPAPKRKYGYYAQLLLWRDQVIGWANVDARGAAKLGFVSTQPREPAFRRELDAELHRLREFL